MSDEPTVRVLVVDDHPLYREGLVGAIATMAGKEVVGEAADGHEAVAQSLDQRPDVVLLDLRLPGLSGVEVMRQVRPQAPEVRFLILTTYDTESYIAPALAAGARGYLLKETASTELVDAVRKVAGGRDYVQPSLGAALAKWLEEPDSRRALATDHLTPREREVLRLIALGHTNAEVAQMLFVSQRTVENHRASVMRKLGLRTRAELVRHATDAGLV